MLHLLIGKAHFIEAVPRVSLKWKCTNSKLLCVHLAEMHWKSCISFLFCSVTNRMKGCRLQSKFNTQFLFGKLVMRWRRSTPSFELLLKQRISCRYLSSKFGAAVEWWDSDVGLNVKSELVFNYMYINWYWTHKQWWNCQSFILPSVRCCTRLHQSAHITLWSFLPIKSVNYYNTGSYNVQGSKQSGIMQAARLREPSLPPPAPRVAAPCPPCLIFL